MIVPVLGIVDTDLLGIVLLDVVGHDRELGVGSLRSVGEYVRVHLSRRTAAVPVGGELLEPVW